MHRGRLGTERRESMEKVLDIREHLERHRRRKEAEDHQNQVEALCRMGRHRRIMVKVGAFYALGLKKPPYDDLIPLIRQVVGAFGPEQCMWETDCPFQVVHGTYEASLALIRDRCDFLSRSDREQILRKTAEAFLFGAE